MSKILIVDDEIHIRLSLQRSLKELTKKGVELLFASNGDEALEVIKSSMPDLIFLDIMMPKKDGYEVCRITKKELKFNNIYIIMLSAKGQETDKKMGIDAGADMYVTKPYKPEEIKKIAKDVLKIV
ncbi:MAG: response regulator [Nitrospirae bacterium]|nr:response regulator [Nitrospirota bacterium]MBF0541214.1 response regulator [Nitrospirota bacterium]